MRIFFDDEMFHREVRGGVTRYIIEVAKALARTRGVQVTVFGGWSQSCALHECALATQGNPEVIHRYWSRARRYRSLTKGASFFWRRAAFRRLRGEGEPVIYHPSLYDVDRRVAAAASALVLTVHDMQLEVFDEKTTHARRHVPIKHRAIGLADWIFCPSRATEADLHRLVPVSIGKTQVVYNDSSIRPVRADDTRFAHPFGGRPYFMMVGARRGYKNGRIALEAFCQVAEQFGDIGLLLCGPRPPGSDGELEFAHRKAIEERIVWRQPGDDELASYYARSLGLVYPSSYEGFGLPVLEAMRCGCPVITNRAASLPEVGGDAAMYVPPEVAPLAASMTRLIADASVVTSMRAKGLEQAARFSWQGSAEQMLQGYRTAMERRANAPVALRRRQLSFGV